MVTFEIPGAPQGKARARVTKYGTFTPDKTVLYENWVQLCYMKASSEKSFNALQVRIHAYFEPAKSTSKSNLIQMLQGSMFPTKKPDIDNIAKVVLDALNGVAYKDDTQIVRLTVTKDYAVNSRVIVEIIELL